MVEIKVEELQEAMNIHDPTMSLCEDEMLVAENSRMGNTTPG